MQPRHLHALRRVRGGAHDPLTDTAVAIDQAIMVGRSSALPEYDTPLAMFARGLQSLRTRSGMPSYRTMAQRVNFSVAALSQADKGHRLPTLELTIAYVAACGGSAEEWAQRWRETRSMLVRDGKRESQPQLGATSTGGAADPGTVTTPAELAAALNALRGGRSYEDLRRSAERSPHGNWSVLPRSTISDLLRGRVVPSQDTLITFLAACGVAGDAQRSWLAAWERVATASLRRPPGATRVRDARPRMLGVHASLHVDQLAAPELPVYVPRDVDAMLRATVTAAAADGGLIVLVGGSAVGKTRSMYEAIQATLPEWWLVHPGDADEIVALAATPTPRTVLWLDELQRYLPQDQAGHRVTGAIRTLLHAGTVVVGTLWPEEYAIRAGLPAGAGDYRYAADRTILALATVISMSAELSTLERHRAETIAQTDERLRLAMDSTDFSLPQVLAAGPQLIRWWENAADPYGKAVITAAVDARRLGVRSPLTRDMLAAAAPGYLSGAQMATAPPRWLDDALNYATSPLHGAVSALVPIGKRIGVITGYHVADFLAHHADEVRGNTPVPELMWEALRAHLTSDADLVSVAQAAERQGLAHHAEALYSAVRRTTAQPHVHLASLLRAQGRPDLAAAIDAQLTAEHTADESVSDVVSVLYRYHALLGLGDADRARWIVETLTVGRVDPDEWGPVRTRLGTLLGRFGVVDLAAEHGDEAWGDAESEHLGELLQRAPADTDAAHQVVLAVIALGFAAMAAQRPGAPIPHLGRPEADVRTQRDDHPDRDGDQELGIGGTMSRAAPDPWPPRTGGHR